MSEPNLSSFIGSVVKPPRELADIDKELKGVTDRILSMIGGVSQ